MEPYRAYCFGLQMLLLVYTAQSFVLLTANMEDIRKLARKFVSDSLADKIAEFIVKATEQMTTQMTNMSDEETQDISGDNNNYKLKNIARNREEKRDRISKDYSTKIKDKSVKIAPRDWHKESNEISKEVSNLSNKKLQNLPRDSNQILNEKINKIAEAKENWQKDKNEISNDKLDRIIQSKINDWQKDKYEMTNERFEEELQQKQQNYMLNKPDYKKQYYTDFDKTTYGLKDLTKMDFHESKPYKPTSKTRFVTTYRPPKAEPRGPDENTSAEERQSSKKHKNREKQSEASYEENYKKIEYEPIPRFDLESTGHNGLRDGAFAMTTEKEKTDFDQYDNRNYPKATKEQFVATSGTMMLPKLESHEDKNWWEKEMKTNVKGDMVHF